MLLVSNIQKIIITGLAAVLLGFMLSVFSGMQSAEAQVTKERLCGGANLKLSAEDCKGGDARGGATRSLNDLIETIVNIFSIIVGIVAVIMIIIGGFKFITSGGDAGRVSSAKNTVLYAIVGLIIVALAQVIVRFISSRVGQ